MAGNSLPGACRPALGRGARKGGSNAQGKGLRSHAHRPRVGVFGGPRSSPARLRRAGRRIRPARRRAWSRCARSGTPGPTEKRALAPGRGAGGGGRRRNGGLRSTSRADCTTGRLKALALKLRDGGILSFWSRSAQWQFHGRDGVIALAGRGPRGLDQRQRASRCTAGRAVPAPRRECGEALLDPDPSRTQSRRALPRKQRDSGDPGWRRGTHDKAAANRS